MQILNVPIMFRKIRLNFDLSSRVESGNAPRGDRGTLFVSITLEQKRFEIPIRMAFHLCASFGYLALFLMQKIFGNVNIKW